MANTYSYIDPNSGTTRIIGSALGGESHAILAYSECRGGLSIRIYNAAKSLVSFSCYKSGTLRINEIPTVDPAMPCDCINGGCVPKNTYNTPGVFATLDACQSRCAKNSNCTGECVDPAEIAAHQQAINNLKAKIC